MQPGQQGGDAAGPGQGAQRQAQAPGAAGGGPSKPNPQEQVLVLNNERFMVPEVGGDGVGVIAWLCFVSTCLCYKVYVLLARVFTNASVCVQLSTSVYRIWHVIRTARYMMQ